LGFERSDLKRARRRFAICRTKRILGGDPIHFPMSEIRSESRNIDLMSISGDGAARLYLCHPGPHNG